MSSFYKIDFSSKQQSTQHNNKEVKKVIKKKMPIKKTMKPGEKPGEKPNEKEQKVKITMPKDKAKKKLKLPKQSNSVVSPPIIEQHENMPSFSADASPKVVKKVKKTIKKKNVDFVDFVVESISLFEERDVGKFDLIINKNITNEIFKNKTFREVIDADKLYNVLRIKDAEHFGKLEYIDVYGNKCKMTILSDDEKDALKNYHQFYNKLLNNLDIIEDGEGNYRYELSVSYSSPTQYGRVYPIGSMSLSQVLRPLRHYIARDKYYDLDFKASVQRTLCGIFEEKQLKYPLLYIYVRRRDEILKACMEEFKITYDEAKKIFTIECFGGSCIEYLKKIVPNHNYKNYKIYNYLMELHTEMELNIGYVFNCDEYKEIKEELLKDITQKSKQKRSFICRLYHIVEMELLKIVYKTLLMNDIITPVNTRCIPSHDGIMIEKEVVHNSEFTLNEIIDEINYNITNDTGLTCLELIQKPMDEHKEYEDYVKAVDFVEYVDKFYELYGITRKQVKTLEYTDETMMKDLFLNKQKGMFMTTAKKTDDKIDVGQLFKKMTNSGMWKIVNDNQFKNELIPYMTMFMEYVERLRNNEWRTTNNMKKQYIQGVCMMNDKWNELYKDNEEMLKQNPFEDKDTNFEELVSAVCKRAKSKLATFIKNLREEVGRNKICNAVKTATCNNDFYDLLDADPTLLGFNNGVLDLKTMEFRKCKDDEFVRMTCGYDFIDPNDETIETELMEEILSMYNEIESDLKNLFLEDSEYDWSMMCFSRCLLGAELSNKEQKIIVMIGSGGNGKGFIDKLLLSALGDYATIFSGETMNKGVKEMSASLSGLYKMRYASISEPDGSWNNTIVKQITSDNMSVRTLYQPKMVEFKPPPLFVSCNPPGIILQKLEMGDAINRRFIQFKMVKEAKDEDEFCSDNPLHIKKKNEYEMTDKRKMAMMMILIKYYNMYKENGSNIANNIPMRFKKDTNEFLSSMNIEDRWIEEQITKKNQKPKKHLLAYDCVIEGQKFRGFVDYILNNAPKDIKMRFNNSKQKVLKCIERATSLKVENAGKCYDIDGKLVSDLNDKIHRSRCFHNVVFGKLADEEEQEI
jgi:hypothetical protein